MYKIVNSLLATCAFCVVLSGCQSLSDKWALDSLKGNALTKKGASTPSAPPLANDYSEHQLCIQTAKTVADNGYRVEAIQLYEKAEKLQHDGDSLDLVLAPLYAQVGDTDKAIKRYKSLIEQGQATADIYNNCAWTLMESGRHSEAIQMIQQGLDAEPDNKRLKTTFAVTLFKQGERKRAFETFRDLYGESAAHHNLAVMDVDSGNIQLALEHATSATQAPNCSADSIALRDTLHQRLAADASDRTLR